jgi:osmotically-inducible protein OsmY
MASKKRRAAGAGARLGARVAPKASRVTGRAAWKAGKGQARLVRFLKYGFFALVGLAVGTAIARSGRNGASPAGQGGETWGAGTPTGTAGGTSETHQNLEEPNRTGAERSYSDPSSGPLIGQERSGSVEGVGEQQEEVEQRIRTQIGEDPRTMDMPRINVEVNDGVAELRGEAPSEEAKAAAGEIASSVEGVREVRNLITVS